MSETKIALRKAVKRLYDTFEKYPKPELTNELYPLSERDLEIYYQSKIYDMPLRLIDGDIMATHGTPEQYKYYLPRIFEFYFEPEDWGFWRSIPKLTLANWFIWDEEERNVINQYMMALWEYILTDYSQKRKSYPRLEHVVETCITGFMEIYPDISQFLEKWETIETSQASLHIMWMLEKYWNNNSFDLNNFDYIGHYFPDAIEDNKNRLFVWLASPYVRSRLAELKTVKPDDEEFQASLLSASYGHDYLRDDW